MASDDPDQRRTYQHDPQAGETRFPPETGDQRGPHQPGERDPHEPVNTPLDDPSEAARGHAPSKEGTG